MTIPVPSASPPGRRASRAARFVRPIVESLARALPPPRDEALVVLAKSTWGLLRGTLPASLRGRGRSRAATSEPILDPIAWRRAGRAFERGAYEEALRGADELIERHPDSLRALGLRRDTLARLGEMSEVARTIERMRAIAPDPRLDAQQRAWLGRLTEMNPRWLPRIPGPPRPVAPLDDRRVLHLLKESLPWQQNGFTMRSRYSLLAQRAAGLDPWVVTSLGFPRKDGVERFDPVEVVDGIPHHRLDLGPDYPLDAPFDVLLTDTAWLAARVARRQRPAIIHASSGFRGFETALVGRALREHLGLPLVYEVRSFFETTWTADQERGERSEHYRLRYETENRCMRAADAVVTIGEAMRADIVARGVPPERVHVIPNGVDASAFSPLPKDPELQARYGIEAGTIVFGYVSNLDHPREGQELLIEAAARLVAEGRRVRCLIVGDGARREELEALARQAGVAGAVVFTGRIPHAEVAAHYALLDVFVVPRRNDRAARLVTPLKPFEAMAMARPLLVADLPALVEVAAPGERGLAFRVDDAQDLARAIALLADDPALRARLGMAGRDWVARERSWDANGPRYRAVYEAVLDGHRRARHDAASPARTPAVRRTRRDRRPTPVVL